jgi:DNA-binding NtrC family response regulator
LGIRESVRHTLTKVGHTVMCAATGDRALELLKSQPFDLLITDVIMPEGDGLNVIMGVKKAGLPVRILVISGGGKYFQAENCVRIAEGLGAHAALFKPFAHEDLLAAIQRAVDVESSAA